MGAGQGPIDDQQLQRLLTSGMLGENSLVWKQGMETWQYVWQVPALSQPTPSLPPQPSDVSAKPKRVVASPLTEGPPTSVRKITTGLAYLLLLTVSLGRAMPMNPYGLGQVVGQLFLFAIISKGIARWLQRKREIPFVGDLVLVAAALWIALLSLVS
jgi:hypothetical protein